MTTEQRLDRIETELGGVSAILLRVAEIQERQMVTMRDLTGALSHLTDRVTNLTESIALQANAADLRMKRIEENLDGLIRAITADHSNGKGNH
jgi:hypothetical protein